MSPRRRCPECKRPNEAEAETCSACGHALLWRRSVGRKGFNRITVYERIPEGPLQILWWVRGGAHRESLTTLDGVPIFDRSEAEEIAKRIAHRIEKEGPLKATPLRDQLLGTLRKPERHFVGELFTQMHTDRSAEWSKKWAQDQRRYRRL